MKLTWFGGTTLRVYVGGHILVLEGATQVPGFERRELVSGADRVIALDEALPLLDPIRWRPKTRPTALAEEETGDLEVFRIGEGDLLIAAAGEPPLAVFGGEGMPSFGRWVDGAVVVLLSGAEQLVATATVLLDVARPKLIALAADEQTLDTAVAEISEHLDGAGLVSLEVGLALEV